MTTKQDRNLVRTRQRQPDFVRKAGPHKAAPRRARDQQELQSALQEWAEDYADVHSVFED